MAGYKPIYIKGMQGGLVQSREEFILPEDAYPVLENAYVWRERLKRRQGLELLGRLQRSFTTITIGRSPASSTYSFNLLVRSGYVLTANNANPGKVTTKSAHGLTTGDTVIISGILGATGYNNVVFTITVVDTLNFTIGTNAAGFGAYVSGGFFFSNRLWGSIQPNAELIPGSIFITDGTDTFTDQGNGILKRQDGNLTSTINYISGAVTLNRTTSSANLFTATFEYAPGLPVMGLRNEQLNGINNNQTIAFDTVYAYNFVGSAWQEFLPGTTWTGADYEFFWSTNYFVDSNNLNIFWVTNDTASNTHDPIRFTNGQGGTTWADFTPPILPNGMTFDLLLQALCILPFRGRLLAFNTTEGLSGAGKQFNQRIRWSAIGTPFYQAYSAPNPVISSFNANAWRDDIRGQGGFLDIPTMDEIISVGFVRDNLVVYCESSTWQLRYTGRSIQPFQIEKVNSELGAKSTFSSVQFDTSLVGVGDKGIVECDSFKSERIDIKIPDLVFEFNDLNNGTSRIHGIRDFQERLAFWTYPYSPGAQYSNKFPNRRLVYNYENDSWAIFTDSLTCLGTFQPQTALTWEDATFAWQTADFPWAGTPSLFPAIIGGNQQGFVEYLSGNLEPKTTNDISLSITAITGNDTTPTVITSPNHNISPPDYNYESYQVIQISQIPNGTPFASTLNGNNFAAVPIDANTFQLFKYNSSNGQFDIPQLDPSSNVYVGGGKIALRDGFSIQSKKFNSLEQGQQIQMGYIDVLMNNTSAGAVSLNVYMNYNDNSPINIFPQNVNIQTNQEDTFFNSIVPTSGNELQGLPSSKQWQRAFCPTRAQFLTIEWTLSNAQLVGVEQESEVQIDSQILWTRQAGRLI